MSTAAVPTTTYALRDSMTMLRRNLKHALRYPSLTFAVVVMPVMMLLMFNYAYGNALGAGIGGGKYIDYVAPGIVLMAATSGSIVTAIGICTDMTEGIVNRFRTMAISRSAFLAGHVVGSVIQTMIGLLLVVGAALAMGFRPHAGVVEWLAAIGLLLFVTIALTWISAGIGLVAKTVESASNLPMPLQFLPFIGSAIVPTDTMPTALRWFAEYQPFTPVIETLRGLLMGTEIGAVSAWSALGWCTGLTLLGYFWSRSVFYRR
ncbi:ABC transporter permease [Streptomyces sp. NRRL WC-3742]|uniref:ABC transporter permease n=1 Tax=Streptomyces sp. NRRL WC-3742 TaxID=1463934 RepID=UPI0004C4F207|nr:ABC transporter permease [Streptomyces sp. NRRL WC-3742]